jgi:hypothetical protein
MARPRKSGKRKPCGRLVYKKQDARFPTALTRMRDFGVTLVQSVNPLAGHLAGVLYLRGQLESRHLGHFYSYLQMTPISMSAIRYGIRVSGGGEVEFRPRKGYWTLVQILGREIELLRELANDRLVCSVKRLKRVLLKVPLTAGGSAYINWCETQHPQTRSYTTNRVINGGKKSSSQAEERQQQSAR